MRRLVLVNSAWLIADKVVRLGFGLVVSVWLARQTGPDLFGLWNYSLAFAALFAAFANLGLDGVVVRELTRDGADSGAILGTGFTLRLVASVLAAVCSVAAVDWAREADSLAALLVALNAAVFVFQCSQIIDLDFQARMRPRPAVIAVNLAFLIASAGRLVLLHIGAPIEWFGVSLVAEAVLSAALLVRAYLCDMQARRVWRFDLTICRRLLSESWPLLLAGLAVMAYMRLDQIMLASIAGDHAVGQFSAALRIAEVWYFIPMAIMTAAFPAMLKKRGEGEVVYERYVQRLYDVMAWLGIAVACVTTLTAHWALPLLYGPQYAESAAILTVQIWAGVSVAMSLVHGKWLLAEGLQKYGLYYTVAGACVNISLNLILIPRYGAIGAAWATLVTQVGLLPIQLFFPRARRNFVLMVKAPLAPFRMLAR